MRLSYLLGSVALACGGLVSPALAQGAAEGDDRFTLEEIVVTAERREVTLQKSSLAMEVVSAERASALTETSQLTTVSPGLQVGRNGPQPQVYIRGIGDQTSNSRGQGAVAFNVDGVYYARSSAAGSSMFDLERIEILKGPQGTLYGRNASGGAINIISARPRLGEFGGYVGAEVGNFELRRATGAVNLPLGETAALRVAGQVVDRDGYLTDGGQDDHSKAVRGRLLWEPTDRISVLFNADTATVDGVGGGWAVLPSPDGDPWRGIRAQPTVWPFMFGPGTAPFTGPNDAAIDMKNSGASIEANIHLGFGVLTLIPAYRRQESTAVYYAQNFRYAEDAESDQVSGEARLGGDTGALTWVAGLYYFREDQDLSFTGGSPAAPVLRSGGFDSSREATAVFAQTTVSATDSFRLIAGVRYTDETFDGGYSNGVGAVPVIPYTRTSPRVQVSTVQSDQTNFKVGAEYDLAEDSMLFLTYATGFKAGGFQPTARCGPLFYGPEELSAWTFGTRNRFLDGRLQANAEVFHWKYKDQQVAFIQPDPCGDVGQLARNIGDATIQGFNLDVVLKVSAAGTLRGSLEFADSEYDRFLFTQTGIGSYAPAFGSRCSAPPTPGRPGFFDINCEGQQMTRTPKWAGTLGYNHRFDVGDGELVAGVDLQYASERWLDFAYVRNGRAPAYTVINAQVTYNAPDDRWSATLYGNNLTEEPVYTSGNAHSVVAPNGSLYYVATILAPRTYGARLRVNF